MDEQIQRALEKRLQAARRVHMTHQLEGALQLRVSLGADGHLQGEALGGKRLGDTATRAHEFFRVGLREARR